MPKQLVPLLNVADVARSLAFYTERLGFTLAQSYEDEGTPIWAALEFGEASLMLNRPDHALCDGREARPSYGDVVLYLTVDDAAALHESLRAAGLEPGPLTREDYGMLEFLVRDPDGYEIAIGTPLAD